MKKHQKKKKQNKTRDTLQILLKFQGHEKKKRFDKQLTHLIGRD